MSVALPIPGTARGSAGAAVWRRHLVVLAAAIGALLLLFRHDAADVVRIWAESSTYNHGFFILPVVGWLVWQRLPELARLVPDSCPQGLLIVTAGVLLWLLGWAGSLALARHLALVAMIQGMTIACLGKAVSRGLAFPLFYLIFLVPVGEEIVPLMQTVTARLCMALLALVGTPAHLEGIFISTPAGLFKVAEACSGVKFLVAMVAYGALVANVCFRSWARRLLFMTAAVVIPVIANGVRAWSIILVASTSGTESAIVYDHVIYGWIFFAVVVALLMAAGWRFFDRKVGDPWFDAAQIQPHRPAAGRGMLLAVAGAGLALAIAAKLATGASGANVAAPGQIELPSVRGWERVSAAPPGPWQPHFAGADHMAAARYRDRLGREVDVTIVLFEAQKEGKEIVGFGQGAVGPDSEWSWIAQGPAPLGGRLDRIASLGTVREVATFYRIGRIVTGSGARVKLETMKARLLGGPGRAVAVLVSAQAPAEGLSPRPSIDAFLHAAGPVDRLADTAVGAAP